MDFCNEIAVFQASFSLAEKIAKDELKNYKRSQKDSSHILETISLAMEEIIAGLEKANSESQQMNWKFKLVTILYMNGFCTEFLDIWMDIEESFQNVTFAIPQISKDLLYDIIETTQMTDTLLKVSAMFPGQIHGLQIKTGLQFCAQEPITRAKGEMAVAFAYNLCMVENNVLFRRGITRKKNIESFGKITTKLEGSEDDNIWKEDLKTDKEMDDFLLCLLYTANVVLKETKETRIIYQWLISVINVFNGLLGEKVILQKHFDCSSSYADCLCDMTQLTHASIVTPHGLNQLKRQCLKLEHSTDVFPQWVFTYLKWSPSSGVKVMYLDLIIAIISKLQIKGIKNLHELKNEQMPPGSHSSRTSDLEIEIFHKFYHITFEEHLLKSKESEIESLKEFLRPEIKLKDLAEKNLQTLKTKQDKAFFYVEERMPGYRDAMQWIIEASDDLVKDQRWLSCMENNSDLLQSKSSILSILTLQNWNQKEISQTYKTRFEKIILNVFSHLPVRVLNGILEEAGRMPNILATQDDSIYTPLVSAFNRLVSNEKVISEIAVLALKSGDKTVAKICEESISNQKQVPILVKLLASLPYLCSIPVEGKSHLFHHLCELALKQLSNREEDNLVTFIDLLLKTSPNYPYKLQYLLEAKELLEYYVLKFLSGSLENTTRVPFVIRSLKIMNSVIENSSSSKQKWDTALFPVIFNLCSLVSSCSVLWQGDDLDTHRLNLKECALQVSDKLVNLCAKDSFMHQRKGVVWLYNKLLALDWRMVAYIQPLFMSSNTHLQTVLPECTLPIFMENPDISYISHPEYVGNTLLVLFDFVKTNDRNVELVKEMLLKEVLFRDKDLHVKIAIVLAKVLPHCVKEEWNRIFIVLKHIVNEENVHELDPPEMYPRELSHCVRRKLLLKNTLKNSLLVINSKYCPQSDNTAMWLHIMKGYSQTLKGIVDLPNNTDTIDTMFLCHEMVIDMLVLMVLLPTCCGEAIFVQALDFLNDFIVSQEKSKNSHEELETDKYILSRQWEQKITQHICRCPYEDYKETLQKKFNKDEKKEF